MPRKQSPAAAALLENANYRMGAKEFAAIMAWWRETFSAAVVTVPLQRSPNVYSCQVLHLALAATAHITCRSDAQLANSKEDDAGSSSESTGQR